PDHEDHRGPRADGPRDSALLAPREGGRPSPRTSFGGTARQVPAGEVRAGEARAPAPGDGHAASRAPSARAAPDRYARLRWMSATGMVMRSAGTASARSVPARSSS